MHRSLIVCLLLSGSVAAVYGQTLQFEFVRWDDPPYIYENPHVRGGLTRHGLVWAFTSSHAANWHPLTWASHMLDCDRFGLRPGGHHAGNVLLHILNTLLLFGVLRSMTAAVWRSALVAALFGLHPLHVESVAWVAERKDVLCTCFGLLALGAYVSYARRPSVGRYLPVFLLFAASLASKAMFVTLPFALLLLDVWPLRRIESRVGGNAQRPTARRVAPLALILEKIPLLALSVASSLVTYIVQRNFGASEPTQWISESTRAANAVISYVRYLYKMIWPTDLSALYHHPNLPGGTPWAAWQVAGAAGVLLVLTALVVMARRRFLLVGWLWYLGTLVPVIGLIQVGHQAMADRYTYVPLIGVFVAVSWGVGELAATPRRRGVAIFAAALILAASAVCATAQARHWRRSEDLFSHGLAVEPRNPVMHFNLGQIRRGQSRDDEAINHFEQSLRVRPRDPAALINLAGLLVQKQRVEEGIERYRRALEMDPRSFLGHYNIAFALASSGKHEKAIGHYRMALRIRPDNALAHANLGEALESVGSLDDAIQHYRSALRLDDTMSKARAGLDRSLQAREAAP